ncbi:MAG: EF-hand domain-containing protein [Sulfuriferula sp.]|nr:EF-hand domain-containing protein [Sulfuriferula sp.]
MHSPKTLVCILGLALAAPAFADSTGQNLDSIGGRQQMSSNQMYSMMMSRFQQSDKDHNGAISKAEASNMPMLEMHFDEVDTNHDGQVTIAEMQAAFQQQMGKQASGSQ